MESPDRESGFDSLNAVEVKIDSPEPNTNQGFQYSKEDEVNQQEQFQEEREAKEEHKSLSLIEETENEDTYSHALSSLSGTRIVYNK